MSKIKPYIDNDGNLVYSEWAKKGAMRVRRDALEPNDPDQTYNHIKEAGFDPSEWGIENPYTLEFAECSRDDLIYMIIQLRASLLGKEYD